MSVQQTYAISASPSLIATNPTFTCGSILYNSSDPGTLLLSTNSTVNSPSCSLLTSNGTVIWTTAYGDGAFFNPPENINVYLAVIWYPVMHSVFGVQNTAVAPLSVLPPLLELIVPGQPQFIYVDYVSLTAVPSGLYLDPKLGSISGIPTTTFDGHVQFALQNTISKELSSVIGTVYFKIEAPSSKSSVSPAAYAVPVGVGLLSVLLLWLYLRHDRRKLFHIFISYRVATDAALAKTLSFKLQQKFLSTGHRVRFEYCLKL